MAAAAAAQSPVRLEAVDSNGIIPLAAHEKAFPVARSFRAFVQRTLARASARVAAGAPPRRPETPAASRSSARTRSRHAGQPRRQRAARRSPDWRRCPSIMPFAPVAMRGGARGRGGAPRGFRRARSCRVTPTITTTPTSTARAGSRHTCTSATLAAHEIFQAARHCRTLDDAASWEAAAAASARAGGACRSRPRHFLDQLIVWRELAFNTCEYVAGLPHAGNRCPTWARSDARRTRRGSPPAPLHVAPARRRADR